jgi:hypothetical protein
MSFGGSLLQLFVFGGVPWRVKAEALGYLDAWAKE